MIFKSYSAYMESPIPEEIKKSLLYLKRIFCTYDLYLVGGCVRDILLGREPKDYDLCTNLKPEQIKELLKDNEYWSIHDTGIKHGTITLVSYTYNKPVTFEITTYRIDGKYSDGRHPDEVTFTPSLEEDLKRRDFTINSLVMDIEEHRLGMLDENYINDLHYGIIRTVGDARERFKEDALRMLRALRFMAQLNFSISSDTYNAIKECSPLIIDVSKERVRDELTKILLSDNPQVLELFSITGLEYNCLGSEPISSILNCPHDNPWHYTDVFHHTMDVIKRVPKTFELRWAALFHDFGKPYTKKLKEGTTNHYNYHGHPEVSFDIAMKLMTTLKFSNSQMDTIGKFVKYHDSELVECKNSTFKKILVDIGIGDKFADFIKLKMADAMAHCLTKDTKYAIDYIDKIYNRWSNIVIKNEGLTRSDLPIDGYDLINMGYKGKIIGEILDWCLEYYLENPDVTKDTFVLLIKSKFEL